MKAGVAISPDTPSTAISDDVGDLSDLLLIMTVYPGELPPPPPRAPLFEETFSFPTQAAVGRSLSSVAFPRSQNSARGFQTKTLKSMEE